MQSSRMYRFIWLVSLSLVFLGLILVYRGVLPHHMNLTQPIYPFIWLAWKVFPARSWHT